MVNFLKETKELVDASGMTPIYIGLADGNVTMTWEHFQTIADFDYDDGFGDNVIHLDFIVAFEDGSYLKREEYDGSEWWLHVKPFKMPENCEVVCDKVMLSRK